MQIRMTPKQKIIFGAIFTAVFAGIFGGAMFIIFNRVDIPKGATLLMFFFGCIGILTGIVLIIQGLISMYSRKNKAYTGSNPQIFAGYEQIPEEDVFRKEIACNDKAGFKELEEYTLKFLDEIILPSGFEDFLTEYCETKTARRIFKDTIHETPLEDEYRLAGICPPEKVRDISKQLLLYDNDFMTQFRDILLFGFDESGHCAFILDYGKPKGQKKTYTDPKVKYLDMETGLVTLLADSFEDFKNRLEEETNEF